MNQKSAKQFPLKQRENIRQVTFLLKLNLELADQETKGEAITPPGLPQNYPDAKKLVTEDCIKGRSFPPPLTMELSERH